MASTENRLYSQLVVKSKFALISCSICQINIYSLENMLRNNHKPKDVCSTGKSFSSLCDRLLFACKCVILCLKEICLKEHIIQRWVNIIWRAKLHHYLKSYTPTQIFNKNFSLLFTFNYFKKAIDRHAWNSFIYLDKMMFGYIYNFSNHLLQLSVAVTLFHSDSFLQVIIH